MEIENLMSELQSFDLSEEAKTLGIDITDENLKIMDDNRACVFLKALNAVRKEQENMNNLCDEQIKLNTESVEKFRESKNKTFENQIAYLEGVLEDFAHYKLDNSKKKSFSLPYGTLQFRKNKDNYEYDNDQMKNFLQTNPIFVDKFLKTKIDTSIDKKELVKSLTYDDETGKVYLNNIEVPGVTFKEGQISFSVK